MKLRTKTILFFGSSFFLTATLVAYFGLYVVGGAFKEQTTNDLRIFAEQSEGAYFTLLRSMRTRVVDWSADPAVQAIANSLLSSKEGSSERKAYEKKFSEYVLEQRMSYDGTVLFVDILSRDGVVLASTDTTRVGVKEYEGSDAVSINNLSIGGSFVKGVVFEEEEHTDPIAYASTRLFIRNASGDLTPLDAVLMIHFLSISDIADVLSGEAQVKDGAQTGTALLSSFETSEIYLVNSDRVMVTPSRYVKDLKVRQVVDTLPVRECLENKKEVATEYTDYRGEHVLGASMCLGQEGLVLLVEVSEDEIFAPLTALEYKSVFAGTLLLLGGIMVIVIFVRWPLRRVDEIVDALERVMKGDFDVRVTVVSKDETGRLAMMFNTMVDSLRKNQKALEESSYLVKEKAELLEKDLGEHQKQEKFLEESKRATLNLLEDSWKAKEKLEEEGSKLQTILSSIGDGLVLIDNEYRIVLVNAKALELFAMKDENIAGSDLRNVIKLYKNKKIVDTKEWPIEEVFRNKKTISTTIEDRFSITTKNLAMQLPVSFSVAPISGRFSGVVIVMRDVTADREFDEAKSGFISVASHQLRTPLTSIRWYSEMLLSEDTGALNDSQKDFVAEIHGGAERLYKTVDLLLGLSRVEGGKIRIEKVPINIGTLTADVVKEMTSQIREKSLTLIVTPPTGAPVAVWLDSLLLRQVLLNLISNAINYTNNNGTIEVSWELKEDSHEIIISVRDTGIGIPDNQIPRIFSKFFRAENARMQVPDGSGLGLALVKNLVESWGGKIWFKTKKDVGSTFFFTIPLTTPVGAKKENNITINE